MSPVDTAVQNWLSSRNINVLPEWIQACLEWIHNEYQVNVSLFTITINKQRLTSDSRVFCVLAQLSVIATFILTKWHLDLLLYCPIIITNFTINEQRLTSNLQVLWIFAQLSVIATFTLTKWHFNLLLYPPILFTIAINKHQLISLYFFSLNFL